MPSIARARSIARAALSLSLALSACAAPPTPTAVSTTGLVFDFPIDCGPIEDAALCRVAISVALTAKRNPPPVVDAKVRRPRADDDCVAVQLHPCGPGAVIVTIQSGDTLQEIPLVPTASGWARWDQIR